MQAGDGVETDRADAHSFDRFFGDGLRRLSACEARLVACGALVEADSQALLALILDAETALLLLRAARDGDLPPGGLAIHGAQLALAPDPALIARLPQPARLAAMDAVLLAARLGSMLHDAELQDAAAQREKPRVRQGRPRLRVVPRDVP